MAKKFSKPHLSRIINGDIEVPEETAKPDTEIIPNPVVSSQPVASPEPTQSPVDQPIDFNNPEVGE